MTTLYDVLELAPDASQEQVEAAYREKVKQYHPDVSDHPDAEDRFRIVKRAEEVLGDPDERARYDRLGHDSYDRVAGVPDLGDWPTADDGSAAGDRGGSTPDDSGRSGTERSTSGSDHSRGISVGDGSDGSSKGSGGSGAAGRTPGSTAGTDEGATSEDDWWDDVFDPGPGGGQASDPRRRSSAAGAGASATGGTARGTDAGNQERRRTASRTNEDSFWDAEVEHPVESTPRREGIATRLRSGESMVLSLALLIVYPVFVYFSFDATLSPAVNVLVGVTTTGVVVAMLTRPAVSLVVFGAWSLLSPLLLTFLGRSVTTFGGLVVLSTFWVPLALTVLVVLAAPR